MKKLELKTDGFFVLVDDDDYTYLSESSWYVLPGHGTYYARGKINGKWILMHRLIINTPPNMFTDHIDGNGLNNCKNNLRIASKEENNRYRIKKRQSKTPFKGITFHPETGKWRARIYNKGRNTAVSLGLFETPEEAARAYDTAAKNAYGNFAKLNLES